MPKSESPDLVYGDVVRRGSREGVVVIGHLPVRPLGFAPAIPDEELCRIRWDGHTFSTVEDRRGLVKVERKK